MVFPRRCTWRVAALYRAPWQAGQGAYPLGRNSNSTITEPAPILTKYSNPPPPLLTSAQPIITTRLKASEVKKVPPRTKGRKRNRETDKPISGLDVDDLFRRTDNNNNNLATSRTKLTSENPIPEFKTLLHLSSDPADIPTYATQFTTIIEFRIRSSFGDQHYERVIEELGVLRDELLEYEAPGVWNDCIREIKNKILGGELGEGRRELWWLIRRRRLGLIVKGNSGVRDGVDGVVSEEVAKEFWKENVS